MLTYRNISELIVMLYNRYVFIVRVIDKKNIHVYKL